MDELLSEKEQVEAIRGWWQENGRFVIGGIVLGVAILVGWNQWKDRKLTNQQEASAVFETLAVEVSDGNLEDSEAAANELYEDYSSTTYAELARLAMARLYMDKGRDQDAANSLQALLDSSPRSDTQMVGRLRLAKIYLYQEKPQEVIDLLSGYEDTAYSARYDELKGDAYVALGQVTEAGDAYARAMNDNPGAPTVNRALVQMKIVDLPAETADDLAESSDAAAAVATDDASTAEIPDGEVAEPVSEAGSEQ